MLNDLSILTPHLFQIGQNFLKKVPFCRSKRFLWVSYFSPKFKKWGKSLKYAWKLKNCFFYPEECSPKNVLFFDLLWFVDPKFLLDGFLYKKSCSIPHLFYTLPRTHSLNYKYIFFYYMKPFIRNFGSTNHNRSFHHSLCAKNVVHLKITSWV